MAEALNAKGIPFILISGYRQEDLPSPILREARMLAKPVDLRQLKQVLEGLEERSPTAS